MLLTTMKYLILFGTLLIMTLATIGNAFYRQKQYYPAVVYLSKSKISIAIGYFIATNMLWLLGHTAIMIFFGELRSNERDELWERLKYIATETLLAFAIFRDDFSPFFALNFALLIFTKIFHWLAEERVDFLERSPFIPKLFHVRAVSHLVVLSFIDLVFILEAIKSVRLTGPSLQIAFGFEYAILFPSVVSIFLKYLLHTIEIYKEIPLQDKSIILTYGQILLDFIKIFLYFFYLAVMFRLYLLPAFAFRQIFNTMKRFTNAVKDVISFKKAVRYMNRCCPTATKEELETIDSICIVCREDMISEAKRLPCNHIFHGSCLRSWFQRQQTCPTCRLKILDVEKKTVVLEPIYNPERQVQQTPQENEATQENKNEHVICVQSVNPELDTVINTQNNFIRQNQTEVGVGSSSLKPQVFTSPRTKS